MNNVPPGELAPEPVESYDRLPLAEWFQTLRRYRHVILTSLAAVAALCVVAIVTYILMQPSRRITSMQFHLQFDGADAGRYPNGTTFSTADIVSSPVLLAVYKANNLQDYMSFSAFSRSVFILETSRAYQNLNAEFETKLREPKLTTVDRERLEREYRDKLRGLGKFDHSINFVAPATVRHIPPRVVRKALGDILSEWAAQAQRDKRVLQFAIPVLSTNILRRPVHDESFFRRLLLLRQRLTALIANIDALQITVPGVSVIRADADRVSLPEIRLELQDIGRYDIDPLIAQAQAAGLTGSRDSALRVLQAQLEYDRRLLAASRARETALRNAFVTYEAGTLARREGHVEAPQEPAGSEAPRATPGEGVTTQLGDAFLDRIVDLTNRSADREYRQQLINDIRDAALAVAPHEATVAYDESLIEQVRSAGFGSDPQAAADVQRRWTELTARIQNAIRQMNTIYTLASQQINADTEMYRITSPAVTTVERPIDFTRLFLLGLLLLVLSVPLILAGCVLHDRLTDVSGERAVRATEAV